MAVLRLVDKNNPRRKGMVPSTKWKIAFFISLAANFMLSLYIIIK